MILLGGLISTRVIAQGLVKHPQGTTQAYWGYLEHLPVGYHSGQTTDFPLLIALHGIGEAGNGSSDLDRVQKHGPAKLINQGKWPADRPFIVIAPQSPGGFFNPAKLYAFIEQMKQDYRVDENRVYLTGLSAGGISIWNYLADYPNQITAAVPIAGKGQIIRNEGICQLAELPIWAFHGSNDGTVKMRGSTVPVDFLRSCAVGSSANSKVTIYSGVGHDSWSRTYDLSGMTSKTDNNYDPYDTNIYDWLLSHTKGEASNQLPTVTLESDKTITLPTNEVTITGSGQDAEGSVSYAWSQQAGPSAASLTNFAASELTASELQQGAYVFRLTVTDEARATAHKDMLVTVEPAPVEPSPAPMPSPAPAPAPSPAPVADNDCGCDHLITPEKTYVNGESLGVQPGDVVCLQAGKYAYLNLYNFRGTAEKPLTFINCGGQVQIGEYQWHYGFVMNNNQHFRLTGTGDTGYEYGIKIDGIKENASGFAISTYSSDFEIDHLEISNTGFAGMHVVMKPTCDPASQKGNYVMRNVNIHHNYIHDTHGEGLYIGHSKYTGATITCDGEKKTVYPHTIEGIQVHDNTIEHTGWDGFQVSCAVEDCNIYNNTVKDYGRENKSSQRAGIVIGGGSTGQLYNNLIYQGTGGGIHIFGIGDNLVYNNVIVEAGEDGIFIGDKTTEAGRSYSVVNNTVVSPGRDGIRMYSQTSRNNRFSNNIIVNPGSYNDYSKTSKAFVYLSTNEIDCAIAHNIFEKDIDQLSFVDPAKQDFRLQATSLAIDVGSDVATFGFDKDHDGSARRVGAGVDAGAYEFQGTKTLDNQKPIAKAGADVEVLLPDNAVLDGSASNDLDGSISRYHWTQVGGPSVDLLTDDQPICEATELVEGTYTFRLTVSDDQGSSASDEVIVEVTAPNEPEQNHSLTYQYYEGAWDKMPDFSTLQPVKTGQVANFDLSPRNRDDHFAFLFEGYIDIQVAGEYTFYTASDDGSLLYVANEQVVDNDGLHALQERQGKVYLDEGQHLIKVMYFEKKGKQTLKVKYEGPGISKQDIPTERMFSQQSEPIVISPVPSPAEAPNKVLVNFNFDQDAPAPWNNTSADPRYTKDFLNLHDAQGEQTAVGVSILTPWGQGYAGSYNDKGEITTDNSGLYPDVVMKTSYWMGTNNVETLKISGLVPNASYQFTFFASRKGTGNRTTRYSIGEETVSLNASGNTTDNVSIVAKSDDKGEIYINVQKDQEAQYGYLSALVIEHVAGANSQKTNVNRQKDEAHPSVAGDFPGAGHDMNVQVYPNPITDRMHLKIGSLEKESVDLLVKDLTGHVVMTDSYESIFGNDYSLDVSNLKSGIYVVEVVCKGQIKQFKIVKG